jgi:2-dehydropantoate 2-reductase
MRSAGAQDVVVIAVKAHQLPALAPSLPALYAPETAVVAAQNGIPWWYFQRHGGPYEGRRIAAVDPDGVVEAHIPAERVIGCVVYPAAELAGPGVVRHIEGDRFTLGELDGAKTGRIQQLARTLTSAGMKAPVRPRIRADIWIKLWGNMAFNPISALTRASRSSSVSPAPSRSARTRPRCSRISRPAVRPRSMRSAARWPSWGGWSACRRLRSTRCMRA